jgi:hypothetical protein
MTNRGSFNVDDFKAIPPGFRMESPEQGLVVVRYKRAGLGCMSLFLAAWLAGWTIVCLVLLFQFLDVGNVEVEEGISFWSLALFWITEIFFACLLAYFLFGRKSFRLEHRSLVMETTVLGLKNTRTIDRSSIRKFIQIKDCEDNLDNSPSWGLKAICDREIHVIRQQPYRISFWLGAVLARWAGVEFVPAPEE